ncbi:MAG: hypothetical protein MK165_11825 [Pirellulaceae bacterium]|nr:hypothetical protein [Pirellulaceae bacterium]
MSVDTQLVAEIKEQLNDDILSFAWMAQIARLLKPGRNKIDCIGSVLDSVVELCNDGFIVVGPTRETNGMIFIDAWPDRELGLRARLEFEIAKYGGTQDQDFCFWIQRTADHAK